jgi:hypothetical protein
MGEVISQSAIDRRSRRAILAGAVAGVGATVARALTAPLPIRAAGDDGAALHVGDTIADAQSQTTLANKANSQRVLWVASNDDLGHGDGVAATGYSAHGTGVEGWSVDGTGVYGHTGGSAGTGVLASASTGNALKVSGKARFSRSGIVNVAAGKSYADITVPGGIASNTVMTATIQNYRSGVAVSGVRRNYPSTGMARIYLTKVASSTLTTPVGWIATEYGT